MLEAKKSEPSAAKPASRNLTIVQALREALREEMNRDETVFVMGEDIRIGGSFLFTLGLLDEYGPDRVLNTPISESGFVGLGIGAAIAGMRPIIDFQYGDFVFCAMDQLAQQASKLRYMSAGQVKIPMVLQMPTGASGRSGQHTNSMEGYFFHVPGIKIVTPATPYDAKGLFKSAVRDDNTVLFCVHKHLYGSKGRNLAASSISMGHVPEEEYLIPLGAADVKRPGTAVTVVSNLLMLHRAMNVAESLAREKGIEAEIVDLRCLVPLDIPTVIESVKKTGRLLIVEETHHRGGWGAQVAAAVAEQAMGSLKGPIRRIATPDVPIPFSPVLEDAVIPGEADIRRVILEMI